MPITPDGLLERIRRNDVVLFRVFGWPISVNKIHALQYGVFTGMVMGLVGVFVSQALTALALLAILVVSFGVPVTLVARILCWLSEKVFCWFNKKAVHPSGGLSIIILTIEHKPHYFWSTLTPTYLGVVVVL